MYIIKQIDTNKFIPLYGNILQFIFHDSAGISKDLTLKYSDWAKEEYCVFSSLKEAKEIIKQHKEFKKKEKKEKSKIKYYYKL